MVLGVCVQVLAEFCAQDEDGQTPLLFAARSGSGAVFRQALDALLARATPEKVGRTKIKDLSGRDCSSSRLVQTLFAAQNRKKRGHFTCHS